MQGFRMAAYSTELPIRPDLDQAHAEVASRWAKTGSWWSGVERLAIVEEVRHARDSAEIAPWESASEIEGIVSSDQILPDAAIDAIWRITNHPGTLTAEWHASILGRGIHPEAYVEMVGVVAQANAVDRFADALDLDRVELPLPSSSEPDQTSDVSLQVTSHWVPTAQIKGPNVLKALSAVPFENETLSILSSAQYVRLGDLLSDLVSNQNSLSRLQVEVIAARTSKLNECFY
tara:strand:+ start:1730 stop:2428 length:699 start_codon:yes stop_codon:yes gene_type:complete